jgi:hypothetical protein
MACAPERRFYPQPEWDELSHSCCGAAPYLKAQRNVISTHPSEYGMSPKKA